MARLEWVRHRLENWARWCQQQDAGGLGYPKQSAFARLGGKGSRAEAVIPTDSIEASETDQAVKSLQGLHSDLHRVLTLTYAQGLPRHLVARKMAVTERTVHANLERADYALARYFEDRKAQRAKAQVAYASGRS
jgi:DNA-directed RNA polymerase specialized sigma24 family protein